jgi:hypothetical protein
LPRSDQYSLAADTATAAPADAHRNCS